MYELIWLALGLAVIVLCIGLGIGVVVLRRSLREQEELDARLHKASGADLSANEPAAPPAPLPPRPAEPVLPAAPPAPPVPAAPPAPAAPQAPAAPVEAGPNEADAKSKVESAKATIAQLKSEGVDVSQPEKLLQLATSTLASGDFERATKYAAKAAKAASDMKAKGGPEKPAGAAPAPAVVSAPAPAAAAAPAAEGEDAQQKEVVSLISTVQAKLANLKEESVEKSEVENLLRLATSFVRSKSYAKALRYAKQAEEKAAALKK